MYIKENTISKSNNVSITEQRGLAILVKRVLIYIIKVRQTKIFSKMILNIKRKANKFVQMDKIACGWQKINVFLLIMNKISRMKERF